MATKKNTLWNVPNVLTMIRLVFIPLMILFAELPALNGRQAVLWQGNKAPSDLAKALLGSGAGQLELTTGLLIALIFFVLAAITDFLDGYIARKYELITDFGKLMDPIADKVLVFAALLVFIGHGFVPAWAVVLMIAREFLVTGFRLVAAGNGAVIAAAKSGKIKTVSQMLAVIVIFLSGLPFSLISPAAGIWAMAIIFYAAVVLTVWSGMELIIKNRHVIQRGEEK